MDKLKQAGLKFVKKEMYILQNFPELPWTFNFCLESPGVSSENMDCSESLWRSLLEWRDEPIVFNV